MGHLNSDSSEEKTELFLNQVKISFTSMFRISIFLKVLQDEILKHFMITFYDVLASYFTYKTWRTITSDMQNILQWRHHCLHWRDIGLLCACWIAIVLYWNFRHSVVILWKNGMEMHLERQSMIWAEMVWNISGYHLHSGVKIHEKTTRPREMVYTTKIRGPEYGALGYSHQKLQCCQLLKKGSSYWLNV